MKINDPFEHAGGKYVLTSLRDDVKRNRASLKSRRTLARVLRVLRTLPAADDLASVTVSRAYYGGPGLVVYCRLKTERRDSPIIRQAALLLGINFTKRQGTQGLSATGIVGPAGTEHPASRIEVHFEGYVPATCKVEEVEEYVPGHSVKRLKVTCTSGEDSEEVRPWPDSVATTTGGLRR